MPAIKPLKDGTAILLTATQVITSPLAGVKELLENALDARATSISIEISPNAIDVVQVRDNGHGIAPDDRGICCRQNTTSKLDSIADLKNVGGRSLGFRGQALFALAEVVGKMEITTRVEGEATAIKMEIGRNGEVMGRSVASQPIGTTVRVTDFFAKVPVRKQAAEKTASKCLASIRKLLQAYALARPNVRLTLRVLQTKTPKLNFMYGPSANGATVQDAAFKVIGTEPASQCSWSVLDGERFQMQAFLPTPEAIAAKIRNMGHFLSVDQRPVSTKRGFFKKVCKQVVEKMRSSSATLTSVKDPFFVINITCPQGSYDPNVEPAKDDVIFNNEDNLLQVVDRMLDLVFPSLAERTSSEPSSTTPNLELDNEFNIQNPASSNQDSTDLPDDNDDDDDGFEALEVAQEQSHQVDDKELSDPEMPPNTNKLGDAQARSHIWRTTMYGCDEDDLDISGQEEYIRPASADAELREDDKQALNPWTIAKLNASLKPRITQVTGEPDMRLSPRIRSLSPTHSRRSHLPRASRIISSDCSDDHMIPLSTWQSSSRTNAPRYSEKLLPIPKKQRQAQYTGLPTPLPSSSPVHSSRRQVQRVGNGKPNQDSHNQFINKPFVKPLQRINVDGDDRILRPQRRSKLPQNLTKQGIDIREAWVDATRPLHAAPLVSQAEPTERTSVTEQIHHFRARLRHAGGRLSSQYTHEATTREPRPLSTQQPTASSMASYSAWTSINMNQHQNLLNRHTPRPATPNRSRATESRRTKSSRLPLERVPAGSNTQHIIQRMELSPAKLESLVYFLGPRSDDFGFEEPAPFQHCYLQDRVPESTMFDMGMKAVELLRQRLNEAEKSNKDDDAFAYLGALARLERADEMEEV